MNEVLDYSPVAIILVIRKLIFPILHFVEQLVEIVDLAQLTCAHPIKLYCFLPPDIMISYI